VVSILKIWSSDTPFAQDLGYDLKDPKTLSLHHRERLGMVREALKKQRFDVLSMSLLSLRIAYEIGK